MTTDGRSEEVIMAGFGGQGIILAGKLLAQAAMKAGKEVTFMPSYGAEVRGGTANCMVVIADEPIACPVVSNPDSLIVMNKASLDKFIPQLKKGGLLILNRSMIDVEHTNNDGIEIFSIPADQIAIELGTVKCSNMVALGAYLQKRGLIGLDVVADSLPCVLAGRYHDAIALNIKALNRGAQFVESASADKSRTSR
jgi:2-oxoglutarate ferredoxin oxidoreductase subunit gamma